MHLLIWSFQPRIWLQDCSRDVSQAVAEKLAPPSSDLLFIKGLGSGSHPPAGAANGTGSHETGAYQNLEPPQPNTSLQEELAEDRHSSACVGSSIVPSMLSLFPHEDHRP